MKKTFKVILYIVLSIILLSAVVAGVGWFLFNRDAEIEKGMLFGIRKDAERIITKEDIEVFPDLMKNYLTQANVIGKPKFSNVIFVQKGKMRSGINKKWMPFTAEQCMSSSNPGFIWKARALPLLIRDKYLQQNGEVKITFMGLKNLAVFNNAAVDQSALGRYLGELIWFPIGFLDPDISWEELDEESVLATIVKGEYTLQAVFYFNKAGLISRYETHRYKDDTLENFIGEAGEYADYGGLLVPTSITAIWDLSEGKTDYFKADIVAYEILR